MARTQAQSVVGAWFEVKVDGDCHHFYLQLPGGGRVCLDGLKWKDLTLGEYTSKVVGDGWEYGMWTAEEGFEYVYFKVGGQSGFYTFSQRNVLDTVRRAKIE